MGSVILAAIEGLNLLLMRVLMPSIEKQQLEQGMEIDRLNPPNDPTRVRSSYPKTLHTSPDPSPFSFN